MLDKIIAYVSPAAGLRRAQARATLSQVNKLIGSGGGEYDAATLNRLNKLARAVVKENDIPAVRIDSLRSDSWKLYRNNPSARKIVRSLESKVVGPGLQPESLAMLPDGTPHVEFRSRAKRLWSGIQAGFDVRGLPGKGGLTFSEMQKLALRSVILSGDALYRLVPISTVSRAFRDLPVSMCAQLIDSCRLADENEIPIHELPSGDTVFRGIQLNSIGERQGYWIRKQPIYAAANAVANAQFFSVREVGHLYIEDDIDQLRGVPWFAAAIIGMTDTSDLQYNVLKASAMAACFVGSYSKPTGASRFGLNQSPEYSGTSADGTDLTDSDGNTITKLQPAMLVNTGKDGKFELHSPNQPNMNPEAFVQHLQRGTATAFPGIKGSTITGDYRNSSFSSERSADNDAWPELHDVQSWFAASFCQPIYETILRNAVFNGYFEGIVTAEEFQAEPSMFSACKWQGPVGLSINPRDDAGAAADRIKAGISSLQMECAKVNVNWRDVLNDAAEVYSVAKEKQIPPELVNNYLGVDTSDQIAAATAANQAEGVVI